MTVCFPPLIKPDGRFSRIRLSEFLCRTALVCFAIQRDLQLPDVYWALVALAGRHHVLPCASLAAEQVASLRSSVGCPNQRSGTGSSLLRTPPTSAVARTAFPFERVAPPVEFFTRHDRSPRLPERHFPTCRPRRPRRSIIQTHDGWSGFGLVGLRPNLRGSAAGSKFSRLIYVVHMFIATCRFDSMPAPHPASRRRSWHGLRC